MHCTLSVNFTQEQLKQAHPLLSKILAKGQRQLTTTSLEQSLFKQFGFDATPIAAVSAQADGLNVGDKLWLMATPVHLVLQRDDFTLHPDLPTRLPQAISNVYLTTLNQHFEQDGLKFFLGQSGQWYVQCSDKGVQIEDLIANHPYCALGQNISGFAPSGQASAYWLQKQNEAQMLLFEHEASANCEQQGLLPVNSVWFYGAGRYPSTPQNKLSRYKIVSDAPLYLGLAHLHGFEAIPLAKADSEVAHIIESSAEDLHIGLSSIEELTEWLTVCYQCLQSKKIKQLTLQLGFKEKTLVVDVKPHNLWRFWRQIQPLSHYFQ